MKKELGILVLLVALCAIVAILNPSFLGAVNLQNLARRVGLFGIFSIGLGVVIITAGIDLTVGSLFALQGVLVAMMLHEWNWPWPLAIGAILAGSLVLGACHGLLVTRARLQPFIVTLCGLLVYRGMARFIAHDNTKGFGTDTYGGLLPLLRGAVLEVPTAFIVLVIVAVVMWVVLHKSVYGRYLFAVGQNPEAARYSGINSRRIIASAYVVGSGLAGISGILIAFDTGSIQPSAHGTFYECYGIAAAALGGCSLRGGEGSVLGIVIGTALLQVLQNLVNLLGISSELDFAVMGAVILVGVMADQFLLQRRQSKQTKR